MHIFSSQVIKIPFNITSTRRSDDDDDTPSRPSLKFKVGDQLFLLDIYPAREEPIPGVDSAFLIEKINMDNKVLCTKETLLSELKKDKIDVLLTLGAGDIDTLVLPIHNYLKTKLSEE